MIVVILKTLVFFTWLPFKTIQILPIECLVCVTHDAKWWDTEMNGLSLLSWARGLVENTKRYTTNSNIVWRDKCYIRSIIK